MNLRPPKHPVKRLVAGWFVLTLMPLVSGAVSQGLAQPAPVTGLVTAIHATDSPQALATQVRAIFSAKCVECHAATLARPKGHFGYVLDLARVAANPKMVLPGDAIKSELYQMVLDNEMPNEKGNSPPLTDEEKLVVKLWIDAGAPAVQVTAPPAGAQPLTWGRRIIRDLGQFHPVTTHFPIALLIVAWPAELLWKRTRQTSWKMTVRFLVGLGALGAVAAAALGWCDAVFANFTVNAAQVLEWHRWFGTATGVWALLTLVLSEQAHKDDSSPRLITCFRVTLAVGVVLVAVSGYLGASLIYGLFHYQL